MSSLASSPMGPSSSARCGTVTRTGSPTSAGPRASSLGWPSSSGRRRRGFSPRRLQMRPDELAIRELHSIWIDAVNAGDLARLLTLMADDVVFLNLGEEGLGRDGFSTKFSAAQQQVRIYCVSELMDVAVVGEVAYTLSRDSLSVSPHGGGEEIRVPGDRMTIYRKQPDVRWLLASDANVLSPVAKP